MFNAIKSKRDFKMLVVGDEVAELMLDNDSHLFRELRAQFWGGIMTSRGRWQR